MDKYRGGSMLENLKERIFKSKDNRFVSLISSIMNIYTLHEYYDEYTSEMIESHAVNDIFIDREEIALYLAFHLHSIREYKSLGIDTELKRIYETAETASKEIVIKGKELKYTNIFNKVAFGVLELDPQMDVGSPDGTMLKVTSKFGVCV